MNNLYSDCVLSMLYCIKVIIQIIMKSFRILLIFFLSGLFFQSNAQTLTLEYLGVIEDSNTNGYIEPTEEVTLSFVLKNNTLTDFINFIVEEDYSHYDADLQTIYHQQSDLLSGDSALIEITYIMGEYLMPWDLDQSTLKFYVYGGVDTTIIEYSIPIDMNFECSDINFLSVDVAIDTLYTSITVNLENTSLWSLQYPGFTFYTNDPYVQFSGQIGYYYVFPAGWEYGFWESMTISPYTPDNHLVEAYFTMMTMDSVVTCDIPFSFMLNETTNGIVSEVNNELLIYPNPVSNILNIESPDSKSEVRIIDILGHVIDNYTISNSNSIDVSNLKNGIYILEFIDKVTGEINTHKLLKQ